MIINLRQKS